MIETNADDVADELLDEAEQIADDFEEERQRALEEARDLAKDRAPVESGRLRDSIRIEESVLLTDVEYAVYQEFGTIYIEPKFFMRDSALDAFAASIERLRQ